MTLIQKYENFKQYFALYEFLKSMMQLDYSMFLTGWSYSVCFIVCTLALDILVNVSVLKLNFIQYYEVYMSCEKTSVNFLI